MSRWRLRQSALLNDEGKVFVYVDLPPYGDVLVGSLYLAPEDYEDLKERLEK